MGRSVPRLSPSQRFAIYQLKADGKSGREVSELCARGYKELAPFKVSESRANEVAREVADERGELYNSDLAKLPAHEVTEKLSKRLLSIADRETERLDKAQRGGKLNAAQLGQLAGAVSRLHDLLTRTRPNGDSPAPEPNDVGEGEGKKLDSPAPSKWVTDAAKGMDEPNPPAPDPPAAPTHAPVGDVALGARGGSFARSDRQPAPPSPAPVASPTRPDTVPPGP
jgi:hypothetical protein